MRPDLVLHFLGCREPPSWVPGIQSPSSKGCSPKNQGDAPSSLSSHPTRCTGLGGKEPQGFRGCSALFCNVEVTLWPCPGRSARAALSTKKTSSRSIHSSSLKEVSACPCPCPHKQGCLGGAEGHPAPPHAVCAPADSSTYATFLFNAFDTDHDGSVSFEVSCGQRGLGCSEARRAHPSRDHGLGSAVLLLQMDEELCRPSGVY